MANRKCPIKGCTHYSSGSLTQHLDIAHGPTITRNSNRSSLAEEFQEQYLNIYPAETQLDEDALMRVYDNVRGKNARDVKNLELEDLFAVL
jgi:hypothetical protein